MTINLSDVVGITLNGSSVVKIEDTLGNILWEKNNNAEEYFYIENLTSSANTLSIKKNNASAPTITVYRSTDKTNWTSIGSTSTTAITYSIPANSKVYLKATTNSWSSGEYIYNQITCSGNHAIGGNIMSLLYGSSFIGNTVFPSSSTYNFAHLFSSYNLKNINNLVLPATTLTDYCYSHMFDGCGGLTSVPSYLLPATTLTDNCYSNMFNSTGLTSIPSTLLPATTLANNCYESMFSGTYITSIPSNLLPATTLADSCYSSMFGWCTSLTSIPSTLLPATTLASGCYSSMFSGCRNITKAPELPATTLTDMCYQGMFRSCSSLNEITCYADDISAFWCTKDWVNGVSATGTFYKMGSANWTLDSVDGIPTGWTVDERIDPINDYFYVENLNNTNDNIGINKTESGPSLTISYSTDKTNWTSFTITGSGSSSRLIDIPANTKLYFKSTNTGWSTSTGSGYCNFSIGGSNDDFAVGGNIMSLVYGDDFIGQTTLPSDCCFYRLFLGSSGIRNINNLVLPATTLTEHCYNSMFNDCTGLTTIPSNLLPATTLAYACYGGMFKGCTGLTTIPSNLLHTTTLAYACYGSMFYGCTGLTSIPSNLLPATTLGYGCYQSMFANCTSLTTIPSNLLPATTNITLLCYQGMFSGCTGLTSIPSNLLPATTLIGNYCYAYMFSGCTGLTTLPSNLLPATTLTSFCYQSMFKGCTSITTAPELPATTLTSSCYQDMFYGCSNLNEITCYADDISATDCTTNWVNGVSATGTFNKKGSANWTLNSVNGIPTGWTVDENSYSNEYFYVENRDNSSNTLSIQKTNASTTTLTVYYSTDKTNWYSLTTSTTKKNITIPANSRMYIKSTNFGWNQSPSSSADPMECRNVITWNGTSVSVGGNIMSLLYGDDFEDKTSFSPRGGSYCFHRFFKDLGTKLDNINNLVLPSVNLSSHCYDEMFKGCSSITSIPFGFLPAPTIPTQGYYQMFEDCTGLTSIPSNLLPAPQVTQTSSYCNMFKGCTGLTSIPSTLLPATEVGMTAYAGMFRGCTGLTTLPSNLLPATNLQYCYGCYQYMFADCTGLTNVPSNLLPATTLESQCYYSMFSGCTGLTRTPNLPAATLTEYCYSNMFSGCTNLEKVICYANDISASNCTNMWLYNVAGSGTFYKLGSASWTLDSDSGIPTGWTVETEYSE